MPVYNDTLEDFNLKWGGTWIKWRDRLVFVHGAYYDKEEREVGENPRIVVQLIEQNKKIFEYDFDFTSPVPLIFNSQFFNYIEPETPALHLKRTGCLKIYRRSRRQNKRSVCLENTMIVSPLFPLIGRIKSNWPSYYDFNESILQAAINPQYPSYHQALEMCTKEGMVALSPNFAVALSPFVGDKYLFSSLFGFIGEADIHNLYVKHPGSYQEVQDFVNRHQIGIRVINAN